MKNAIRLVFVILLLAALPLRGYAAVLMTVCESQHGGAAVVQAHAHEHGENHDHDDGGGTDGQSHAASVCGMCASCCAGVGLSSEATRIVASQSPGTSRIPFFDRQVSGFLPDHLERPPLAL